MMYQLKIQTTVLLHVSRFVVLYTMTLQVSTKLISVLGQDIAFNAVPKWLHITISG